MGRNYQGGLDYLELLEKMGYFLVVEGYVFAGQRAKECVYVSLSLFFFFSLHLSFWFYQDYKEQVIWHHHLSSSPCTLSSIPIVLLSLLPVQPLLLLLPYYYYSYYSQDTSLKSFLSGSSESTESRMEVPVLGLSGSNYQECLGIFGVLQYSGY